MTIPADSTAKFPLSTRRSNTARAGSRGNAPLAGSGGREWAVDIAAIRVSIELAKRHERETGHLQQRLTQQLPQLHIAIVLPHQQPAAALVAFAIAYIERVPDCLEAAATIATEAAIEEQVLPLLQLALDYFLKPPEVAAGRAGLDELLYEAYLAHRLLEEANDRYLARVGIPLIPLDATVANLICHHLIGEPFANELDEAVEFSIDQLLGREKPNRSRAFHDYVEAHRDDRWEHERQRWPCLTAPLSIDLYLAGYSRPASG